MNELYLSDVSGNDIEPDSPVFSDDVLSVSDGDIDESSGRSSDTVSSGDDTDFPVVSGGDSDESLFHQSDVTTETELMVPELAQTVELLGSIDAKLNLIIGFALFVFCFQRIRFAVKGFTGKGAE